MKSLATIACALLVAITSLAFARGALSQARVGAAAPLAAGYDLSWWTIDGGGYTFSSGGEYELGGTIGQPDAWRGATTGAYSLSTGFWSCGPPRYDTYLPLVLKRY
jgi:NADPH-dependent 2,4-dienoyl-CoA reductase/sulfur reductase-like enzyme